MEPKPCETCEEVPRGNDPALSQRGDGKWICVFCGYWEIPPGPAREELRKRREPQ